MGALGLQSRAIGLSQITPQHMQRALLGQYTYCSFLTQGAYVDNVGYGPPTGTSANVSRGFLPAELGGTLPIVYYQIGTQTIVAPTWTVAGLGIAGDLTDTEGVGYLFGADDNIYRGKHVYTTGANYATGTATTTASPVDTAFCKFTLNAADVSGITTLVVGFRKVQAFQAALTGYTDVACVGLVATDGNISTRTRDDNGTAVTTDTGLDWADAESHTFTVLMPLSCQPTIIVDSTIVLSPPKFTWDSGDAIVPFLHLVHATTAPGAIVLSLFESGWRSIKSVTSP